MSTTLSTNLVCCPPSNLMVGSQSRTDMSWFFNILVRYLSHASIASLPLDGTSCASTRTFWNIHQRKAAIFFVVECFEIWRIGEILRAPLLRPSTYLLWPPARCFDLITSISCYFPVNGPLSKMEDFSSIFFLAVLFFILSSFLFCLSLFDSLVLWLSVS